VRQIAADCFHPGGEDLTRQSIASLSLDAGARVLDLGCGTGTSALLMARDFQYDVTGIDRSFDNIERARQRARALGRDASHLRFLSRDAADLPFARYEFDAVLAECTFSLFENKAAVLTGIKRVMRPGGMIALSDMAVNGALPDDVRQVIAPWSCLEDAFDDEAYVQLFKDAGFGVKQSVDESQSLLAMVAQLKRKLLILASGVISGDLQIPGFDPVEVRHYLDRFARQVSLGRVRYLRYLLLNPG